MNEVVFLNSNLYGSIGAGFDNPRILVLKFFKKIVLNNQNAYRFIENENWEGVCERAINTIHLLEELDMMLNKNTNNEARLVTANVSKIYKWLISVFEEVLSIAENNDKIAPNKLVELIKSTETVIENLQEGFKGMKDE